MVFTHIKRAMTEAGYSFTVCLGGLDSDSVTDGLHQLISGQALADKPWACFLLTYKATVYVSPDTVRVMHKGGPSMNFSPADPDLVPRVLAALEA